jgi:cytochrome P450
MGLIAERRRQASGEEDLLGILISEDGLADALVRDQLITLLIAGHDTSTSLISWALYLIGRHPETERRIRDELGAVLGGGDPDLASIAALEHLELAIKETLRLYPPIHLGSRVAAVDVEYAGYVIPRESRVVYSIYLTHRMERYWPSADQFIPARFTTETFKNLPPYTYLPFGGGPRNCIGFAFARMEALVVLARIYQRFHILLQNASVRVHMGASLEPRPGVLAEVTPLG